MTTTSEQLIFADRVLTEAADVVVAAVQTAAMTALRRATGCGCRGCKAAAARTAVWAAAMLHAEEPEPGE